MAIETTHFVNTTVGADNAAEVYAWLRDNAADYFDSFAISEDGLTISCYIGELEAVTFSGFGYSNSTNMSIKTTLTNGKSSAFRATVSTLSENVVTKGIKTASGICLQIGECIPLVFVTKTADGDTMIAFSSTSTVSSSTTFYAVVPTQDTAFTGCKFYYDVQTNTATTLAPIASVNAGLAPNLFIMPFNQYKGTEGIISLNGTKYYTNGYIALAE